MAGFIDKIATINSAVRTVIALVVVGAMGTAGWIGYTTYNRAELESKAKDEELARREQRIAALEGDLELAKQRVARLETSLRLLKVDHRLAYLDVLDQGTDARGEYTEVAFIEVDGEDRPVDQPKTFRVSGDTVHVAGWVVNFEDRYIENADPERGAPLFLFKSLYGEFQKPADGFPLDKVGTRPGPYNRGGPMSAFEKQIWDKFWEIANDEKKAQSLGIAGNHGSTAFLRVKEGRRYKLELRAGGGLTFTPAGEAPKPVKPAG
jgi:hypothetical protein